MKIVYGNILDQNVDVIVNAWNRNIIPWWMLLPQGVSVTIKKSGGFKPFIELSKYGAIPLGQAVLTQAGKLNYKGIIHVAGINMLWRATEKSIRDSISNSIDIVNQHHFKSVAFPTIGTGSGSFNLNKSIDIMTDEFSKIETEAEIILVVYKNERSSKRCAL